MSISKELNKWPVVVLNFSQVDSPSISRWNQEYEDAFLEMVNYISETEKKYLEEQEELDSAYIRSLPNAELYIRVGGG